MLAMVAGDRARFEATTEQVGGRVRAYYTATTGDGPERKHEYTTMIFPDDAQAAQWLQTEADIRGVKSFPTKRI
jgi:hypothetical protein